MRFKDEKGRIAWLAFAVGIGLMVGWYVLRSIGDVFAWLGSAYSFVLSLLMPFIIATLLAYIFQPVVDGLQKLMTLFTRDKQKPPGKISRGFAVVLFILSLLGLFSLGSVYFFPALARNIADIVRNMPDWLDKAGIWLDEMVDAYPVLGNINTETMIDNLITGVQNSLSNLGQVPQYIFSIGRVFGNSMVQVGLGSVVLLFLLFDPKSISGEVSRLSRSLIGEKRHETAAIKARKINEILNNYLRARLVESLLLGVLTLIGLAAFGVRFSVLIAVIVALFNLVPYVGSIFSFMVALLLTLLDAPSQVLAAGIIILAAQALDNALLIPLIVGDSVGLSPIWTIFATALFGKLLGVIGMLLAPPIMAIVFLFIDDFVQRKGGALPADHKRQSKLFRGRKTHT